MRSGFHSPKGHNQNRQNFRFPKFVNFIVGSKPSRGVRFYCKIATRFFQFSFAKLRNFEEILVEKHPKIYRKGEILDGINSEILSELENLVEIAKSQYLLLFFKK